MKRIYSFMERIGQPITKMPSLGYQELDLHRLFHAVIVRGGMDEVTRKQEWKLVYQELEIPTMSTSASYNTRTNYKKYLYLYELEVCDWGEKRPADAAPPRFKVGDYVRIESSVYEGQVFYASIVKYRYRNHTNSYYVHYNGWSTSHDEWMPENVLDALRPEEQSNPANLANPSPTRSSKSNYIIYDPMVSEKHHHPSGPTSSTTSGGPNQQQQQQHSAQVQQTRYSDDSTTQQSTPKSRRLASSRSRSAIEDEQDETDYFFSPSNNSQHQASAQSSPYTAGAASRRRRAADRKDQSNGELLLCDEHDHPVQEDQLHGYPRQSRKSGTLLDFSLDDPEQVYYNGGRWKHSTPQVRRHFLHRTTTDAPVKIRPEALDEAMKMPNIKLPSIPALPKEIKMPKLNVALPQIDPKSLDRRSTAELKLEIDNKERRLRALRRDLKQKAKLLKKYYGHSSRKTNNLLKRTSAFLTMSRR